MRSVGGLKIKPSPPRNRTAPQNMPRPLQRVRLESGLKLDLNGLAQRSIIRPGAYAGPVGIAWTNSYTGEQIASGFITAEMSGRYDGWFQINVGQLHQRINLITQPRHFGGQQYIYTNYGTRHW